MRRKVQGWSRKELRGGNGDEEEGTMRRKERRGGRSDEEEGATRMKERRGEWKNKKNKKRKKKFKKNEKRKSGSRTHHWPPRSCFFLLTERQTDGRSDRKTAGSTDWKMDRMDGQTGWQTHLISKRASFTRAWQTDLYRHQRQREILIMSLGLLIHWSIGPSVGLSILPSVTLHNLNFLVLRQRVKQQQDI